MIQSLIAWTYGKRYWLIAAGLLLAGLYLRWAHLASVQSFTGDQARDYWEVMRWAQEGQWPLLGPQRAGRDFTIGPGWFYTLAPSLILSNFHPAAGAGLIGLFGIGAAFFGGLWVWRTTGSRSAGLILLAALSLSAGWIVHDRQLWNPHLLPCVIAFMALLIDRIERRPVPSLAVLAMLTLILPQWHTTGVLIILAALPFVALGAWRARAGLRQGGWRSWRPWALALLVEGLLLYVPPVIYELKPGPGNMATYLQNTFVPDGRLKAPLAQRLAQGSERLVAMTIKHNYSRQFPANHGPAAWVGAGLVSLLFAVSYTAVLRRFWRTAPLAPAFLALLFGGFWLIAVLKGDGMKDYFVVPVLIIPALLAAWTAGTLLRVKSPRRGLRLGVRGCGAALVCATLILTLGQLPQALWVPYDGRAHFFTLGETRQIARHIAKDAGPCSFSVFAVEAHGFGVQNILAMLRQRGRPALNDVNSLGKPLPREKLGETLYFVVRGKLTKEPLGGPLPLKLDKPKRVADAWIYRLPASRLPVGTRAVQAIAALDKKSWAVQVVKE